MSASRSRLKIFRYSSSGMILPFVAIFAGLGAFLAINSHAGTVAYVNFLDSTDAAQTANVSTVPDSISQIGPRNVSQVAPGGQLDYLTGGKVTYSSMCYYVRAVNYKGTSTVAKVEFVGQGNSKVIDLAVANNYQPVCVGSGHSTLKGYNVYNMSPADGPNVLVDQVILSL